MLNYPFANSPTNTDMSNYISLALKMLIEVRWFPAGLTGSQWSRTISRPPWSWTVTTVRNDSCSWTGGWQPAKYILYISISIAIQICVLKKNISKIIILRENWQSRSKIAMLNVEEPLCFEYCWLKYMFIIVPSLKRRFKNKSL